MKTIGGVAVMLGVGSVLGCASAPDGQWQQDAAVDGEAATSEAVGETRQEVVGPSWARYGAAAVEVNRGNGGQELWVVACREDNLLAYRLKKIDGNWSSWTILGSRCTATPSLAVWRTATSPEVPVAYYRNDNALMEMTFVAPNAVQLVNLSQLTGFGALQFPGQMDPKVSYFDTVHKQISVLAWKQSDNMLYSVDFYSGNWHYRQVEGNIPATARTVPWFSKRAGENSYFSYPIGTLHTVFHRGDIIEPYRLWKVIDDTNLNSQHLVTFGGADASCATSGCAFTVAFGNHTTSKYTPLSPGSSSWTNQWLQGYIVDAPVSRHGGDPNLMFSFGGLNGADTDKLFLLDLGRQRFSATAAAPSPFNTLPVLPDNVYDGSKYENDMFYTRDVGGKRALYYAHYDPPTHAWSFKDMGLNVTYSL